ncbi:MAG: 6-pyruvoyl trahydropterin synthase family protein [Bryobacteraceae bacterium]
MLITRRAEFSASHSCYNPRLSEEENHSLYGESAGAHGHGHNYMIEVTLDGEPDPVTGMIFDLKRLKEVINREVIAPMDHRFLNREVPPFDTIIPTPENIAREVWNRLEPHLRLPKVRLHTVKLFETEDLYVEYSGREAS